MKTAIAFVLYVAAIILIAVIISMQHRSSGLPFVQSAAPTQGSEAAVNRLWSPCPLNQRNLPFRPEREA